MTGLPAKPIPGQPVRAETVAKLIEAIEGLYALKPGQGITIRKSGGGLTIALDFGRQVWLRAIVRAVHGPPGWAGPEAAPVTLSQVTYDLEAIDRQFSMTGVTPYWGRPVHGDEVMGWAAPVGRRCFVARFPGNGDTLAWIEERIAFADCPGPGDQVVGPDIVPPVPPDPPLPPTPPVGHTPPIPGAPAGAGPPPTAGGGAGMVSAVN